MPRVKQTKYKRTLKQLTMKINNAKKQIIEAKVLLSESTSNTYIRCKQEIDSLVLVLNNVNAQYSKFIEESDKIVEAQGDDCDLES